MRTLADRHLHLAIARAAALAGVPEQVRVQPIDPELAADPAAVRKLDAFIVREQDGRIRPVVYLNVEAPLVQHVLRGTDEDLHVLAALIVHEVLHLKGASEAEASEGERQYIARMMQQRKITDVAASRYLQLLTGSERRPPP